MAAESSSDPPFPPFVCPADQHPLVARDSQLVCPAGHRFAVDGGIPRLVVSDAGYVAAFGDQWNAYRLTQLDSYTGTTITRDRLRRCVGSALWSELGGGTPRHVLEAGCGAGRFTEVLLSLPATRVTSTDLSSAVDANAASFPPSARHRVAQCDIGALPFPPGSYDLVVALGVIQHTPDPERTIRALYAQAKPGGWLVLDHYTRELSYYTKVTALLLRPVVKALPPQRGLRTTEQLTRLFFPLHRAVRGHLWAQRLLSRLSPVLTYFHEYPELDDRLQYEWALLDTHDHLTDRYKHFRSVAQIRGSLTDLGATDVWVEPGGNGVEARCRKPAS